MLRQLLYITLAIVLGVGISDAQASLLRPGSRPVRARATAHHPIGTGHIVNGMPYAYGHPAFGDLAAMHHR